MLVRDVLKNKDGEIRLIVETAALSAAAALMAASQIGALIVEDADGALSGLISEREITAAVARWGSDAHRHMVREMMVRAPLIAHPEDTLMEVTAMMTHHRARHVPILSEGKLVGILSIGDVLKSRLDEKIQENLVLQDIARWRTAG
ncbi:MAG: CBS domain-containing protein [Cupriavidus sp.]|nr:MAG: CBS domain-containing protein [Cupriavidus sp.]